MQYVDCPLDYSLCRQTVTIYRKKDNAILRQVVEGCYFYLEQQRKVDADGCHWEQQLQLIMPGDAQRVFPGDRVMEGVGPEIALEQWNRFVPAMVQGLAVVTCATPYCWDGRLCHVEAGGK